jgi:4-aminobutyrate aminotransferase-like enzyme
VVAAVQQQAEHALHSAAPLALHDRYVPLCEKLNRLAPGARQRKTFLTNSGVEAVEKAVKIARAAHRQNHGDQLHQRLPRPHRARVIAER